MTESTLTPEIAFGRARRSFRRRRAARAGGTLIAVVAMTAGSLVALRPDSDQVDIAATNPRTTLDPTFQGVMAEYRPARFSGNNSGWLGESVGLWASIAVVVVDLDTFEVIGRLPGRGDHGVSLGPMASLLLLGQAGSDGCFGDPALDSDHLEAIAGAFTVTVANDANRRRLEDSIRHAKLVGRRCFASESMHGAFVSFGVGQSVSGVAGAGRLRQPEEYYDRFDQGATGRADFATTAELARIIAMLANDGRYADITAVERSEPAVRNGVVLPAAVAQEVAGALRAAWLEGSECVTLAGVDVMAASWGGEDVDGGPAAAFVGVGEAGGRRRAVAVTVTPEGDAVGNLGSPALTAREIGADYLRLALGLPAFSDLQGVDGESSPTMVFDPENRLPDSPDGRPVYMFC